MKKVNPLFTIALVLLTMAVVGIAFSQTAHTGLPYDPNNPDFVIWPVNLMAGLVLTPVYYTAAYLYEKHGGTGCLAGLMGGVSGTSFIVSILMWTAALGFFSPWLGLLAGFLSLGLNFWLTVVASDKGRDAYLKRITLLE